MNYSLEVNNISKTLGKNLILDDINFKLEKGKIYGLVGANGSGKSTLLKIILGLYDSKGEVIINGYNLRYSFNDALRSASGIVDFVSFYEYLTAYENLKYFALLYEVPVSRIDEVLKMVGLRKSDKTVKKFSLGMKQRLGLAIALLKDPSVLILDEPTNGLDPKGILELRNLLLSFEDKTIIISSHIIAEIEKIVDEVLFINNKKLYQKTIGRTDGKSLVKIIVNDIDKAIRVLNKPQLKEDKGVYMSDDEVSKSVKKLRHPEVMSYIDRLGDLLSNLDQVYRENYRKGTYWIVKNYGKNVKVTIKINTDREDKYMNSIVQMQFMRKNRMNKYISKGIVKKIFDKYCET